MRSLILIFAVLCTMIVVRAQEAASIGATNDSGGVILPEQAAIDIQHYDLSLAVDPERQSIAGTLTLEALVVEPLKTLVLHLDSVLKVEEVKEGETVRSFVHEGGLIRVDLGTERKAPERLKVSVRYAGTPRISPNPPWKGGFTWKQTKSGAPWIATSCQGEGADLWWPCKDHPSDEPSSFDLRITVPKPLVVASNGRLQEVKASKDGKTRTFHWHVSTPINNYGVALNIAPYEEVKAQFKSIAGDLVPVVFYALPESAEKARKLMPEILEHLEFFEKHFGPYPFRGDKYGVAETPHLGMEHQTIIAYGYGFKKDRAANYDWLHHHELSHEWWGNLVTARDWRDMWIHEGIGTYTQALYIENKRGAEGYRAEMAKNFRSAVNVRPLAPREATGSHEIYFGRGGSNDIYMKGAAVLHTLRYLIGKEKLLEVLRRFAYPDPAMEKTKDGSACRFVDTDEFHALAEKTSGLKLDWFFEVYFRQPKLPILEREEVGGELRLQWKLPDDLPFPMPVEVQIGGRKHRVEMNDNKGSVKVPSGSEVHIDPEHWILRSLRKQTKD